ncbi:MAG: hypothetical protein IJT23_03270 [Clostridia bacterium]|nr:hypothetical protein [Clostridia bacterium]
MYMKSTLDVKLRIKPVQTSFLHHTSYEGVCRTGAPEQLTLEYDKALGMEEFMQVQSELKTLNGDEFEVMEPTHIPVYDDFMASRETIDKLCDEVSPQDLLVFSGLLSQHPMTKYAMRYSNPVAMYNGWHVDGTSFLRSIGRECEGFYRFEDLKKWAQLLRTKKAISYIKVLLVEKGGHLKVGLKSSIYDLVGLEKNLGVEFVTLTSDEVLAMYDTMPQDHPDWVEEAKKKAAELAKGAVYNNLSKDYLLRSTMFYVLIKKLLEKYECNAFSMPCREVCAGGTLMDRKFVFCLTHSLLKDEGIVSACEGDLAAMMGIAVLMNISRKAPHMGNNLLDSFESRVATVHHNVPCVHMDGYDKSLPYALASFTVAGWGASMRYDFSVNVGDKITLLRFDPSGTKMMAVRGTIVSGDKYSSMTESAMHAAVAGDLAEDNETYTKPGCAMMVKYQIDDAKKFYEKEKDYGHHFALVFGDYVDDLRELAKVMHLGFAEA